MRFQFMMLCAAGRHGENFRPDELSAANIELRVANHDNFLCAQIFSHHTLAALERCCGDLIAVFVVVRKSAELENLPKPKVAQLEFRAQFDVAGKQSERGW